MLGDRASAQLEELLNFRYRPLTLRFIRYMTSQGTSIPEPSQGSPCMSECRLCFIKLK
jgi:hypothetical protein